MKPCGEKGILVSKYVEAVKNYSHAVTELDSTVWTSQIDFDRLYQNTQELRSTAEDARSAMEFHIAGHKC